ncbi:hypothetical protein F506_17080 [Herbaspirillum hiltneri N3]|uniref:Alpha/beta hydrolase n=1 Tax=Herbaspirillum hiltneri N3 TaxID=1262470 RepID=A0ABM5V3G3_9BURK|nr:alpha/beta fold hydrolase [Herbaspirillum hiltneri]AKZ64150.1 hypothetical protein F506_17080 [Herbaspirillum hiltneri N3]
MSDQIDQRRRRFFGAAAATVATAQLSFSALAHAQTQTIAAGASPATAAGFTSIKQIDAGVLNIGYAELGPANGKPVILLHGWPYDIHSFADVAPLLAAVGHRVIVPHLRGHGSTRFLSADAALAAGLIAEVADDENTLPRTLALAETIAAKSPLALRLAKEAMLKSYELGLEAGLNLERKSFSLLAASEDRREGIAAFKEKRTAQFIGR